MEFRLTQHPMTSCIVHQLQFSGHPQGRPHVGHAAITVHNALCKRALFETHHLCRWGGGGSNLHLVGQVEERMKAAKKPEHLPLPVSNPVKPFEGRILCQAARRVF